MSKTSAKQRYIQLMEWLSTRKSGGNTTKTTRKFSKADTYKQTNNRYGK
jgi:hypothetical protein|tara:strand:+ start:292 stop:438 length:147 start_codon:yes stop_codon:yes gene_type:complete